MSPRAYVYSALAASLLALPSIALALTVAVPTFAPLNGDGTVAGGSSGVTVTCSAALSSMTQEAFSSGSAEILEGGTFAGGATVVALSQAAATTIPLTTLASGTLSVKCTYTATSAYGTSTKFQTASAGIAPSIITGFSAPPAVVLVGSSNAVSVDVSDPTATFAWTATAGSFTDASAGATTWIAPATQGTYTLTVTAASATGSASASAVVTTELSLYQGGLTTPVRYPRRVAKTPEGDLLAVDDLGALVLMTKSGGQRGSIPSLTATAVTVGGGSAFVATRERGILRFVPSTGRLQGSIPWRYSSSITGLAWDGARQLLWVSAYEAKRVIAFRLDGTRVREISTAEGRALRSPADVELDVANDLLWVAEKDGLTGNRLHAYAAADGTWVRSMVTAGTGLGQVVEVGGITLDPAGRVFVSDTFGGKVQVMTSTGAAVGTIGSKGDVDGYLLQPRGLAFMANGDLAIANSWFNRIDRFGTGAALPSCEGDADCDGLSDAWEAANFGASAMGDPSNGLLDPDGDGLNNAEEYALGSNPNAADSDGDGYSDRDEVVAGYDPLDGSDHEPSIAAGDLGQVPPGIVRLSATPSEAAACVARWRQVAGPRVRLRNADTYTPSFVAREAAIYRFEVGAVCGTATSASAAAQVEVVNVAPIADAGRTVTTAPGRSVSLNAAFSGDANGDALTYSWTQRLGPATTVASRGSALVVRPQREGYYEYAVTARDRTGASDTRVVGVVVADAALPTAIVSDSILTVAAGGSVTLDASASLPGDANVVWRLAEPDGGVVATTATASVTIPAPGRYVFEAVAEKGEIRSPPARVVVLAGQGGVLPTAVASAPETGVVTGELALDGGASVGGVGSLTYAWRQLAGPAAGLAHADAAMATAVPFAAGVYVFELTVTDESGAVSAPATVRIDVESPARGLPVAAATGPAAAAVGELVVLSGQDSVSAARFRWSQVAGPWVAIDCTSVAPVFVPTSPGTYVFELVVDDGQVRSAPATVAVVVQ